MKPLHALVLLSCSLTAFSSAVCQATPTSKTTSKAAQDIVIDAVVATVNEKPITLSQVLKRLQPPRNMPLSEASHDPEVRSALDSIIMEMLVEEEADRRKVGVSDGEIQEYIVEVASRNNMTEPAFEQALAATGKTMPEYKKQVRLDILRSKLISTAVKGGVSVSDQEIDAYVSEHQEMLHSSAKLKLRQIFISTDGHSDDEAQKLMAEAQQKLSDGDSFSDVAESLSEGPEAKEGGMIGLLEGE